MRQRRLMTSVIVCAVEWLWKRYDMTYVKGATDVPYRTKSAAVATT